MSDVAPQRKIDELLDRAYKAINDGDRAAANVLAEQVLSMDRGNTDAEDLLSAQEDHGEIRRLTLLFADLVDSTALSTRVEPETYRTAVSRYKERVREVMDRFGGHIGSTKGDGLLCVFGHPTAHENDVERAVLAGLDITREVAALSDRIKRRFGFEIAVRVGIHRGAAYLDVGQDDVYGLAANLTARVSGLAPPGTVVVSAAVESLIRREFELEQLAAQHVKGVEEPVDHFLVLAEATRVPKPDVGPLVGRDREVAQLRDRWSMAMDGTLTASGLAFCGEAGIGKSRLAAVAVDLANQAGAPVLELHGSPLHTDVGLHPVRGLIERRCGIDRSASPTQRLGLLTAEVDRQQLPAETIPLLAPVLGISPQAGYEPAAADGHKLADRIAETVHAYVLTCAGDGSAVLLAEDVHWYDEDTADVLRRLLDTDTGRLLVVMTSRERSTLPTSERTEIVDLAPLSDAEADALIGTLNPDMEADARRAVRRRCDGIPLYIDEVVAKLSDIDAQPTEAAASTQVPDTLYEALVARLRSSRNAVRVVEAAAIIGSRVDRRMLLRTVDLSEGDVDSALRELVDARVLEQVESDRWNFRHELLREVATELSPPSLRRRMHGRVADALVVSASTGTTDWRVVAGHCERADRHDDAASAYQRASREAQRRGAIEEARGYLTRGLDQVALMDPGSLRDRREVQLRLRRGFLYSAAEGSSSVRAAADFERCLQLRESELSDDLLATLTALYGYYAIRADLRRAQLVLEAVLAGVSNSDGSSWPTLTAGFGMIAWYRGEFDTARSKLEDAASNLDQVGSAVFAAWFMPNDPIASVHTHLAIARFIQGDLVGAEHSLANTETRCGVLGLPQGPFSQCYGRQFEALMRIESGDLAQAAEAAGALTREAYGYGLDAWMLVGAAQTATVAALDALSARAHDPVALQSHVTGLTAIVDDWRANEIRSLITTYDGVIARLLIGAKELTAARDRIDLGLALARETGMHYYDAELLRIRAQTHTDAVDRAADLRAAVELARRQGAHIFELRAAADDFECSGDDARQSLINAVDRFRTDSTWPELARAKALLK